MAAKHRFYGKCFVARSITNFAKIGLFSNTDGQRYIVNYAEDSDEQACRDLVVQFPSGVEGGGRGGVENVDVSEYLDEEDLDVYLFGQSVVFAVRLAEVEEGDFEGRVAVRLAEVEEGDYEGRGRIVAIIVIQPSLFSG